ncbi:hypothetical protein HYT92_00595, partial [Candidatus Pacearchaeota archaeon]|nr:hypothetical protein [Candidatus Pacearchaeota archaeon]
MSKTCVAYPIVAALKKAEEIVKPVEKWAANNEAQRVFLEEFFSECQEEISRIPEIESIASWSANVINKFLKERGFSIQLQPFDSLTFGVASVLDVLVEWLNKGDVTSIKKGGVTYPAVRIESKHADFFEISTHKNPIVCLHTKSGDLVHMTILDNAPDGFDMVEKAQELFKGEERYNFSSVVFPMVSLNQDVDISWLIGLRTKGADGQPAVITQALQQTKLRMNEEGARAQSAVAIAVFRGGFSPEKQYVIDKPFLFWITRPGICKPLFVACVTE